MFFPPMNTATHVTWKQTTSNVCWKNLSRRDRLQGKEHPPSTWRVGPGGADNGLEKELPVKHSISETSLTKSN